MHLSICDLGKSAKILIYVSIALHTTAHDLVQKRRVQGSQIKVLKPLCCRSISYRHLEHKAYHKKKYGWMKLDKKINLNPLQSEPSANAIEVGSWLMITNFVYDLLVCMNIELLGYFDFHRWVIIYKQDLNWWTRLFINRKECLIICSSKRPFKNTLHMTWRKIWQTNIYV